MSHSLSPEELSALVKLLDMEAKYRLDHRIMHRFLSVGTLKKLHTHEPMIDAGVLDTNIYIVKSGLIRGTFMDGNLEKTAGFALPGTMMFSFHCFYANEPSYYRFEACCPTELFVISKSHYDRMIAESHEFTQWILSMAQNQCYYNEHRSLLLSGDAKTRLIQLTNRLSTAFQSPETEVRANVSIDKKGHDALVKNEVRTRWKKIFRIVPSRMIASYLGITEQHLSKIKKELLSDSGDASAQY
ncbi:MAG: Crp/Fnr family transcriptional regulator [Muribaculaceae bacterium]|nr:Crp/Fnr family transcriptional regulator [Muribaculaceae bacterium]